MNSNGWGNSWSTEAAPISKQTWDDLKPDKQLKKQGSNLVDNEGLLYFQCHGCEAIHDPETKSFARLQDTAHKAGWKIKWNTNGLGYKIYCVKCRDSIEAPTAA